MDFVKETSAAEPALKPKDDLIKEPSPKFITDFPSHVFGVLAWAVLGLVASLSSSSAEPTDDGLVLTVISAVILGIALYIPTLCVALLFRLFGIKPAIWSLRALLILVVLMSLLGVTIEFVAPIVSNSS